MVDTLIDADAGTGADKVADTKVVADAGKTGDAGKVVDAGKVADGKTTTAKTGSLLAEGPDDDDAATGPATWPDDWREKMAGKDSKELSRYADPAGLWKKVKHLEKKLNEKVAGPAKPGDDAIDEDRAAYRKATGIPDKPEGYFDAIKLPDGKVLGEADKPVIAEFAKMAHAKDYPAPVVADFYNLYQEQLRTQAENQVVADEGYRVTSRDALRDEWGNDFKRNHQAATATFKDMPAEISNAILTARTADGRLVGNIPELVKWAAQVEFERNPSATVVGGRGTDPKKSVDERVAEIRTLRRSSPDEYAKNQKALDAEELELIEAQLKTKNRGQKAA